MAVRLFLLHATAELSWTRFTVHWSTVIGLAALGALYLWRARVAAADPSLGAPPSAGQRA